MAARTDLEPDASGTQQAGFALAGHLDVGALQHQFRANGYVHIPAILRDADAARLHEALTRQTRWSRVFNDREKHFDFPRHQIDALPPDNAARLLGAIHAQARTGFQYCYDNYPIYDAVRAGAEPDHPLHEFLTWLNGDVFIQFVRDVVGDDTIAHVDAQATAFGPGHFLNAHDDLASGKDRRAAYVFGFTPDWRADWGGLLQFIDSNGDVRAGLCPRFNCLNLLAVPQLHNVGVVAPFAGGVRLSITGWLRGEERNGGIDLNEE